jgi:hypothetical protein
MGKQVFVIMATQNKTRALILLSVLMLVWVPFVYGQTDPEATAEATPEATPELTPEATAEVEPCLVSAESANTVIVRVGPGENRTAVAFLPAETEFVVQGQAEDVFGALWFQLDKEEAAPGKLINEAWVAALEVISSGDCEAVGEVDAPPIIPIAPDSAAGTPTGERITARVPARGYWVVTDAVIQAGQTVTISARGNVSICTNCAPMPEGPAGSIPAVGARFPMQGAPRFSLIGRIDGSAPFYIGAQASFVARTSGNLELAVNDDDIFDNSGAFIAVITISE